MFSLTCNLVFAYPIKTLEAHGNQHGNVEILGFLFDLLLF